MKPILITKDNIKSNYLKLFFLLIAFLWFQSGYSQNIKRDTIQEKEFTHYLENGKKVKTVLENYLITYTKKGFISKGLKENIEANLKFLNSNKTKGEITYYKDGEKVGNLKFEDGQLIKGKITAKLSFENKSSVLDVRVINNQFIYTIKPEKNVGFYMKTAHSTAIPSFLSYKNYAQILFMFLQSDDEMSIKFLLDNGSLLTELIQSPDKIEGVIVEYEVEDEKTSYQVYNFIDISMNPEVYDKLSFEEMLEKVAELKNRKRVPNKPTIQNKTGKTISGFYNLSGFEMAAELYLLDNYYFFYSAVFGSVDLEIYGTYSIVNDQLYLHPNEEQTQPYILYAHKNKTSNTSTFLITKTRLNERDQVYISINDKWFLELKLSNIQEPISFELPINKTDKLIFGINNLNSEPITFQNTFQAKKGSLENDFLLNANPYAEMRQQFSNASLTLNGDAIIKSQINDTQAERQDISNETKELIIQFIDNNSRYKSVIVYDNKTYYKKPLTTISKQVILQSKDVQLIEVK